MAALSGKAICAAVLVAAVTVILAAGASAQTQCYTSYRFVPGSNYSTCAVLNDNSTLAWTLDRTDNENKVLHGLFVSVAKQPAGWVAWGVNRAGKISRMANSTVLACYNGANGPAIYQLALGDEDINTVLLDEDSSLNPYNFSSFNVTKKECFVDAAYPEGERIFIRFSVSVGAKAKFVNVYGKGPTSSSGAGAAGTGIENHDTGDSRTDVKLRDFRELPTPTALEPLAPPSPPLVHSPPPPSSASCPLVSSASPGKAYLGCSYLTGGGQLLWKYASATSTFDVVYSQKPADSQNWISWGINELGEAEMSPSSSLVCFQTDAGDMKAAQYYLAEDADDKVNPGGNLNVTSLACVRDSSGVISLVFSIQTNASQFATIWGYGPVRDSTTGKLSEHCGSCRHSAALRDFSVYGTEIIAKDTDRRKLKNAHGILAAVGWGTLLPVGGMIARYAKPFADPAWFYSHILAQAGGYTLGVVAFALGIRLHALGFRDNTHLAIAVAILVLGTLQILVVTVKPDKKSPSRIYWNIYHHAGGYCTIALSIVNIFIGFHLLEAYGKWRTVYIAIIAALGGLSLLLEVLTWTVWLRRPSEQGDAVALKAAKSEEGGGERAEGGEAP